MGGFFGQKALCATCFCLATTSDRVINDAETMSKQAGSTFAPGAAFQPTQWSVVLAAGQPDSTEARTALDKLCQTYWYPVYAFVRRRGFDRDRAKDLTQELFSQLIEKRSLEVADRERGRFRSFLLGCLQHLLSHEYKKEQALKRGGGYSFVPLDDVVGEQRYGTEPTDEMSPEKLFERRWALTLLQGAMDALKREYTDSGRAEQFEALHWFISGSDDATSYAQAAARLGLNENAARQAAFRMRNRYRDVLRELVAQTVAGPEELDAELAHLRCALSR